MPIKAIEQYMMIKNIIQEESNTRSIAKKYLITNFRSNGSPKVIKRTRILELKEFIIKTK